MLRRQVLLEPAYCDNSTHLVNVGACGRIRVELCDGENLTTSICAQDKHCGVPTGCVDPCGHVANGVVLGRGYEVSDAIRLLGDELAKPIADDCFHDSCGQDVADFRAGGVHCALPFQSRRRGLRSSREIVRGCPQCRIAT